MSEANEVDGIMFQETEYPAIISNMEQRQFIKKKCKRYNIPGHAHELTFSCYRNQKFLMSERTCQWLIESIERAREKHNFSLWAFVLRGYTSLLKRHPLRSLYFLSGCHPSWQVQLLLSRLSSRSGYRSKSISEKPCPPEQK